MVLKVTGAFRRRTLRGSLFLLVLLLPSLLYAAQATTRRYKIILNNGREISCSQYYERNGQIIVVRSFGEITYNKDDVVEIREESETLSESSAPSLSHSRPAASTQTGQCGLSDLWFRAELRRVPRDTTADRARLDELIAVEQAKIAELERQLPALIDEDESLKIQHERDLEARREEKRNARNQDQIQNGITGEDVIALSQRAAGISVVQGAAVGEVIFEDPAPAKRKLMERELSQRRCNLFWAEKKRSDPETKIP